FQQKCLGKIDDVARSGRTVLFVTHNMAAVYRLATSVVWLDRGRVMQIGRPRPTIAAYLGGARRSRFAAASRKPGPQLLEADVPDRRGPEGRLGLNPVPVTSRVGFALPPRTPGLLVGIGVLAADGTTIFPTNTNDVSTPVPSAPGESEASVTIPGDVLLVGD